MLDRAAGRGQGRKSRPADPFDSGRALSCRRRWRRGTERRRYNAAESSQELVMNRYVYGFTDGGRFMDNLLGGKGAGLAEMTRMGLDVPPGFTVTTEACRVYLETGEEPADLHEQVSHAWERLENEVHQHFGADRPLLVAVRSGAQRSMPGMMDTVLNVGLNDRTVEQLAAWSGDDHFAWESYARFVRSFALTVLGMDEAPFEAVFQEYQGAAEDWREALTTENLRSLSRVYQNIVEEETGRPFPQDPRRQMDLAVRAVFASWQGERAQVYRKREHISETLGTAVNVCLMVFGNLGPDSGTGVAFTRDPASGASGVYGDYLRHAVGEDIVAGIRNAVPLQQLEVLDPKAFAELCANLHALENHYRDMCDIEFTIERGKLWMLQTRVGQRSAEAAFRIAVDLVDEGLITCDEAVLRVGGERLSQLLFPRFDDKALTGRLATGVAASPGAAVGQAVFDAHEAARRNAAGDTVILVRPQTRPEDLPGMLAAAGILTSQGGKTSHAAVVARGLGRPCVCGAEQITVDVVHKRFTTADGTVVHDGDSISIDGTTGQVFAGELPLIASPLVQRLQHSGQTGSADADASVRAVERILGWADDRRRLGVLANADTVADAEQARRFGASGIGLCRTEHMFLGERRPLVEALILADTPAGRQAALDALLPLQREDFTGILRAMDGLPVTVRLIDPPLHEFLPDLTELSVKVATSHGHGKSQVHDVHVLEAVRRMHEQNPMLGLRGVRLGLTVPGLFAMQVRALAEAAAALKAEGLDPRPEIMVPLVGDARELRIVRQEVEQVLAEVAAATGITVPCPVGTMIELPRAALTAGEIAGVADFFSFGTNDLTQTTWGFSRDDVEASFFPAYLDRAVFETSPFQTIDPVVGQLVRTAAAAGRDTRPDLGLGVCGEHGGDPESIRYFDTAGLDYVSCSPYRVPGARLEAGRAALLAKSAEA
ncbi:MAG: pyruvate, phosphate dikinase [Catenulispora sp.]|nr:pyruvate, phosphate dikinase [Catenulispora sp.]